MGIIFGNQPEVEQPAQEEKVAAEAPQEAEVKAENVEQNAPTEDFALSQEVAKPVRRGRKRK